MVELIGDALVFSFPEIHPTAALRIEFVRTLRIPDDGSTYPLPPGLGAFPLRHVDDFAARVPLDWSRHGGVMLPMYQSEALWLYFTSTGIAMQGPYPFAVKVAAGRIDAVSGRTWSNDLHARPQDYLVVPRQPWLDGFSVEKGVIRQFVAMPLGAGYTAEEQITGEAEWGGLQILVRPMKRDVFERRFPRRVMEAMLESTLSMARVAPAASAAMGLAPGGRMRQTIAADPFGLADWEPAAQSRCFVHIANSLVWQAMTGAAPPTVPPTARTYTESGMPWFDYYDGDQPSLPGSDALRQLQSVIERSRQKGEPALPENESVTIDRVIRVRDLPTGAAVRDGAF